VGFQELEMIQHRMAGKAELAGDARTLIAGSHRRKGDAAIHHVAFDAVETPEKIEMPPGAAEFAIGDGVQPGRFLLLDDRLDSRSSTSRSTAAEISSLAWRSRAAFSAAGRNRLPT
jgi:hypothetical protein